MKHSLIIQFTIYICALVFISSCSSNLFSSKKFNLDLVKVEKKPIRSVESISTQIALIQPKGFKYVLEEKKYSFNEKDLEGKGNVSFINLKKSTSTSLKSIPKNFKNSQKGKPNSKAVEPIIRPLENSVFSDYNKLALYAFAAAILSLTLLISLVFLQYMGLWFLLAIAAFILGVLGYQKTRDGLFKGKGLAIASIILGGIQLLALIGLVGFILFAY